MNVVLCDDDSVFLTELKKKLSIYNCSIYTFKTIQGLLESNISYDIAFLDIELENNTYGFQAVRALRMRNKSCIIAFFTNYDKYAIKGYDYNAFRYILKKEPDILINRCINDVFREYTRLHKSISGSYSGYKFNVALDDIYYISSNNHILTLHTKKEDFEFYKQMKDLEKDLCDLGFLRCHKCYMVNMKHIMLMRSDHFFILSDKNHTAIPVGITFRNKAENIYLQFVSTER